MTRPEEVARGLTGAQREALMTLPLPRDADPVRWLAARSFSDLWRKSSAHWNDMRSLEKAGLVERKLSRGETLWRPTKEIGLAVRRVLEEER